MKKIIACVLSIAVLFAFAACEASTPVSYYGKNVDSITLLNAPDYVVGEILNPSDFSFRVVYNNGETTTRNGAELGLAPTKSGSSGLEIDTDGDYELTGDDTFGIAYGTTRPDANGSYSVKAVWPVVVKAAAVNDVDFTVDPTNAVKEIKKGASLTDDDLDGLVVTAEFENGNTKIVSASIAKISTSTFTVDTAGAAESTTTVKVANSVTNVTIDPAWTLTIKEETNKVADLKLEFAKQEIFEKAKTKTLLSNVKFNVVVTFEDGTTETIASDSLTSGNRGTVTVDFTEVYAANTYVQDKTNLSYAAVVKYDGFTKNTSLTIEYTEDYPTQVTVTPKDANKKYLDTQVVDVNDFTYTGSGWKSEHTYTDNDVDADKFLIQNATILIGEQATGNGTHSITIVWKDETLRSAITVSGVTSVNVKQDA